jgi:hypothetical protein
LIFLSDEKTVNLLTGSSKRLTFAEATRFNFLGNRLTKVFSRVSLFDESRLFLLVILGGFALFLVKLVIWFFVFFLGSEVLTCFKTIGLMPISEFLLLSRITSSEGFFLNFLRFSYSFSFSGLVK